MNYIETGLKTNPYKIKSISIDKVLALPGSNPTSMDRTRTIKMTVEVVNAHGRPANAAVIINPYFEETVVAIFDENHIQQHPGDIQNPVEETETGTQYFFPGRPDGVITLYVCSNYTQLFTIDAFVAAPTEDYGPSDTRESGPLAYYDYLTFDEQGPYQSLQIFKVDIPGFDSLKFGMRVSTRDLINLTGIQYAAVICNDNLKLIQNPSDLISGFILPYIYLSNINLNNIVYLVTDGSSTSLSMVKSFFATGHPLAMPFPDKGTPNPRPQLNPEMGNPAYLDTLQIAPWGGVPLLIPILEDVKLEDEDIYYYLYIYLNGYDSTNGAPQPYLIKNYRFNPAGHEAGGLYPFTVPIKDLLGYAAWGESLGYMWADCIGPKNETWTRPWGPIRINFY